MTLVVLGLGSNIGDRLAHLRRAVSLLKICPDLIVEQISPVYISDALLPENAPREWDRPHLNLAVRCTTEKNPEDVLQIIKSIEAQVGRKPKKRHWGAREIDIDILMFGDEKISSEHLTIPHAGLIDRPFALWPLADVAPAWMHPDTQQTVAELAEKFGSRFSGEAPFRTRMIPQRVDTPQLIGILNVTPDSYSDGGKYNHIDAAIEKATALIKAGADVIDIGAESTSPTAAPIDAITEWKRLDPILSVIHDINEQFDLPAKISIDTRHTDTAAKALKFGVDWINDVSGLDDLRMRSLIRESGASCVVMHHLSIPENRNHSVPRHENIVRHVYEWCEKRLNELLACGIAQEQIIMDPGIGFGVQSDQSWQLIQQADYFKMLNVPILLGYSRKSFLSLFTHADASERDIETVSTSLSLLNKNIDYLRVHDVESHARAFRTFNAIASSPHQRIQNK